MRYCCCIQLQQQFMFQQDDIDRLIAAGFTPVSIEDWYAREVGGRIACIRPSEPPSKELLILDPLTGAGWRIQRYVLNGVKNCIEAFHELRQAEALSGWTCLEGEKQLSDQEARTIISFLV